MANQFILTTKACNDGKNAKQFVSYARVAPFPITQVLADVPNYPS